MKCPKCGALMTHFISEELDDELYYCTDCETVVKWVRAEESEDDDWEDDE